MRRFLERVLNLVGLRRPEADLSRQIDAHLALLQEGYEARGMTQDAARRAARIAFGGLEETKERHRDARSFRWIQDARQDVALGVRLLRRSPLFTLTAALSLAIGIGADTAIFTVANSLILRPPAGVDSPDTLIDIGNARGDGGLNPLPYATYLELARRTTTLSSVFAQDMSPHVMSLALTGTGGAERLLGQYLTNDFFTALGSSPALGRVFAGGDSAMGILDYAYWKRRFNGEEGVIGRKLRINGRPVTIVGVAAAGFQGTGIHTRDIWLVIGADKTAGSVVAGGRLRPGVSAAGSLAELAAIGNAIDRERGVSETDARRVGALPLTLAGGNRNIVFGAAAALMVLVSLVLAVACANVAGIVLTRSAARAREMALRAALGAGRGRLVRQLLTETVVLYLLGGFLGVGLSLLLVRMTSFLPSLPTPVSVALTLDWRVLVFSLSLSLVTAVLFGVLPAFKGARVDPGPSLKDGVRSTSGRSRARNAFLLGQIALSALLVVLGASFVRVLRFAGATDPGFDPRGVEIVSVDLSMGGGRPVDTVPSWRTVVERVRLLPDVSAASLARVPPGGFEGIGLGGLAAADGPLSSEMFSPAWNIVEVGYFTTLRIPLVAGRDFTPQDRAGAPGVAILSQSIAQRFWPGQYAVGKSVRIAVFNVKTQRAEGRLASVIGVASDIKSSSFIDGLAEPYVYLPLAQSEDTGMTTTMSIVTQRRGRNPIEPQIGAIIREIDPNLVVTNAESLADAVELGLAPQRVLATVTAAGGLVGLLLASMGLYGTAAYTVALRRREFAIRLALGAPRVRLVGDVLRRGLWLVAIGTAIGFTLAAGVGQVLSTFLYGLTAIHVPTLVATAMLFAAIGGAACVLPAGRAVRSQWQHTLHSD